MMIPGQASHALKSGRRERRDSYEDRPAACNEITETFANVPATAGSDHLGRPRPNSDQNQEAPVGSTHQVSLCLRRYPQTPVNGLVVRQPFQVPDAGPVASTETEIGLPCASRAPATRRPASTSSL
jgi:hypothetical protein